MFNPMDLSGRKILITGASRGIGKAAACLFARLGARLVLVARDRVALDVVLDELEGDGHVAVPFDLGAPEGVDAIFQTACTDGYKLNGFLHAAGIALACPVKAVDMDGMLRLFNINFFSFMMLTKHFIKPRYSDGGSIVAISSVAGSAGWQGLSVYGASKGALDSAVKSLGVELARKYRVNAIAPSNIKTDMLGAMLAVTGRDNFEKIEQKQPLGFGEPEDVAGAAAFLMSDAGRFITGTTVVVDGGYLAM